MGIYSNYIEIDSELINLSKISKIKKIKINDNIYGVVLEEHGIIIKILKYSSAESAEEFYTFLKNKLVQAEGDNIIVYNTQIKEVVENLGTRIMR